MKNLFQLFFLILFFCHVSSNMIAQAFVFQHEATTSNIKSNYTTIDHTSLNGKSNMVLIVTPITKTGTNNSSEIGVKYTSGKWTIYNLNTAAKIPAGQKFNVMAADPTKNKNAFTHKTSSSNIDPLKKHHTKLSSPVSVSNTYAFITPLVKSRTGRDPRTGKIIQTKGKINNKATAVWLSGSQWRIYNVDQSAMPSGVNFNIILIEKNTIDSKKWGISGSTHLHKNTLSSTTSYLAKTAAKDDLIFATQAWISGRNSKTISVGHSGSKGYLKSNISTSKIPINTGYNIAIIKKPLQFAVLKPQGEFSTVGTNKPISTVHMAKIDPNKFRNIYTLDPGKMVLAPSGGSSSGNNEEAEEIDESIKGPNKMAGENIVDLFGEDLANKLNIKQEIFKDKNDALGFYYYLPKNYTLEWDKTNQKYAFYIQYLTTEEGEEEKIKVTLRLTPNLNLNDLTIAQSMLKAKKGSNAILVPMIIKEREVILENLKNINGVKQESIIISLSDDNISDPITIEWIMQGTGSVDDFVNSLFSGLGYEGTLNYHPYGEEQVDEKYIAAIKIKVNDEKTYGGLVEFQQTNEITNGFKNSMDYPMKPREIILLRKKSNKYKMQSIDLNMNQIDANNVSDPLTDDVISKFQGDKIEKLWITFDLIDCELCDEAVKLKLMGGASGNFKKDLEVLILPNILESVNGSMLIIDFRSPMTAPGGDGTEVFKLKITEDNIGDDHKVGGFYLSEGAPLNYEYKITLATDDDFLESEWISKEDSGGMRFLINKSIISEALGLEENDDNGETDDNDGE